MIIETASGDELGRNFIIFCAAACEASCVENEQASRREHAVLRGSGDGAGGGTVARHAKTSPARNRAAAA